MKLRNFLSIRFLVLSILLIYVLFFTFRGYTHHQRLSAMRQNVLSQIKDEAKINRRLNTQMFLFQDKNHLEYLGRKHLLMVQPNEVLYRFVFEKPVKK